MMMPDLKNTESGMPVECSTSAEPRKMRRSLYSFFRSPYLHSKGETTFIPLPDKAGRSFPGMFSVVLGML